MVKNDKKMIKNDNKMVKNCVFKDTVFKCETCNYNTYKKKYYDQHINTKKHNFNEMIKKIKGCILGQNGIYTCEYCNYNTEFQQHFKYHIESKKHKLCISRQKLCISGQNCVFQDKNCVFQDKNCVFQDKNVVLKDKKENYECQICKKKYKYQSGLSRHMKKVHEENKLVCINNNVNTILQEDMLCNMLTHNGLNENHAKDLILQIKSALKNEINQEVKHPIINITNNNNYTEHMDNSKKIINKNNTQQVLNYLNNECKDALSLENFLETIKYNKEDLNYIHDKGVAESFNKKVVGKMMNMKKTERPIHCTDSKRNTFYVKYLQWILDKNDEFIKKMKNTLYEKQATELMAIQNDINLDNDKEAVWFYKTMSKITGIDNEKFIKQLKNGLNKLSF